MSLRNQKIVQQFANVTENKIMQSNALGILNVNNPLLPISLSNSSALISLFSNSGDPNKFISRLQYNFDGTWNGALTNTNIFNNVPANSTVVIDWSFTGIQINVAKGSSGFNYSGKSQFRQVALGTLIKTGVTDYNLITNDTGDTFGTVPDLIAGGALVELRRALTTTKSFETYFTAEVKILR